MLVTITFLELKNPFKFFALSYNVLKILKQLKASKSVAYKSTGFWTMHYTMSHWNSLDDMHAFAKSGAHLQAMKYSATIAKEIRTLTVEATTLPDWKEAKRRIMTEGKVLKF